MNDLYILGIETSCDETAAAVVKNGTQILSNVVASQIEVHKRYGGVVPEIASRQHVEQITIVIEEAMRQAELNFSDLTGGCGNPRTWSCRRSFNWSRSGKNPCFCSFFTINSRPSYCGAHLCKSVS